MYVIRVLPQNDSVVGLEPRLGGRLTCNYFLLDFIYMWRARAPKSFLLLISLLRTFKEYQII